MTSANDSTSFVRSRKFDFMSFAVSVIVREAAPASQRPQFQRGMPREQGYGHRVIPEMGGGYFATGTFGLCKFLRPHNYMTIKEIYGASGVRLLEAAAAVDNEQEAKMPFVSVTRLRVRSMFYLPQFLVHALRSSRQAQHAAGFLGGRLMREARNAFWTVTVWSDAKNMEAYRTAGAHRDAMPKLLHWCDEASVAHWTQDSSAVPQWAEAHERMAENGRASKVNHPSADQTERRIPRPRPSRFSGEIKPIRG